MTSNSILTERENGTYYTGPIEPAKAALIEEYGDDVVVKYDGELFTVEECRGSGDGVNQWGTGATEEEAWRYLIGADFGPLDDTYMTEGYETHQRRALGLDE